MKNDKKYYYRKADNSNCFIFSHPSHVSDYIEITKEEYDAFREAEKQSKQRPERPAPTAAELARRNKLHRIASLKSQLSVTDYVALKLAEALAKGDASSILEEYADVFTNRESWRAEINTLEEELNG